MKFFTHYWLKETWETNRKISPFGCPLDHISGSQFIARGIEPGDVGYVVNIYRGELYLCGKMIVGKIATAKEAKDVTGNINLYKADQHVLASESTEMIWDRIVPRTVTREIRFESKDRPRLLFNLDGTLDGQTLRPVRLLTRESANLLDQVINEEVAPYAEFHSYYQSLWKADDEPDRDELESEFESGMDGSKSKRYVTYYERNRKNRAEAIRIHKLDCKGCGMNFEQVYGERGRDFIHVHHTVPVAQYEKARKIDVAKELTVLCANCHAMVHRERATTLSVEGLREIIANKL